MANLELLRNVTHRGIIVKQGMIVSGLAEVAQDLIDRGLARATDAAATHTVSLVNAAQEATALGSTDGGQKPNAETDDARKATAQAQQTPADKQTQNQVADQAGKEAQVKTVQPTPEQVANVAAAA